jgi:hypothetical protein
MGYGPIQIRKSDPGLELGAKCFTRRFVLLLKVGRRDEAPFVFDEYGI